MITRLATWVRTLRVPTAEELARMSDDQGSELYSTLRRERARAAVLAEMQRRDLEDEQRAREAARRDRARAKREAKRDEYALYVYNAWIAAESDCRGYLLSKAGLAADVEPAALWSMPESRAMRYASEELRDWWRANGRVTFRLWQQQAREQRPELVAAA